ncbi:unnamed protein product [Victoria cruziana]
MPPHMSPSRFSGSHVKRGCRHPLKFCQKSDGDLLELLLTNPSNRGHKDFMNSQNHPACRTDVCHFYHTPKVLGHAYSSSISSGLSHWFKNWNQLRKSKLTASTFGGAVGFWRGRRVQLWLEKLGLIDTFHGNLATCWSNIQEVVALERYKLITGNCLLYPEFRIYNKNDPADDWLAASPDGVIEPNYHRYHDGGVLEVKCPFFRGQVEKALPWVRIPPYHMPQAQGLMEILDKNWLDYYVWTPNGSSLFRIERNGEYWELLKSALADFWWGHVVPAKELCSGNPMAEDLRLLKPAPKHELCQIIVQESNRLADEAQLLVREIHGKVQRRV